MKTKLSVLIAFLTITCSFAQDKIWTLKECVDYAVENNITILQNKLNVDTADQDLVTAKGNFLPDLNASSRGSFNSGLSPDANGILRNTNNLNVSFNLSSVGNIFNGFRNLNTRKQAELGIESSKLVLETIKADISLNVVNAYLTILFGKENLVVSRTQYEISTNQIEAIKSQVEFGVLPKGDLLNAESTAATDEQNVITDENALNLALLSLAQLLQIPSTGFDVADIEIDSPTGAMLYDNSDVVYEKALQSRPEIARAQVDVDNANLGIEIAKGAYLPTLSYNLGVGSSYFYQFEFFIPGQSNPSFGNQFSDRLQYGGGLSLNIPIFNRNQSKANVSRSIINKDRSELSLKNEKLLLQQTIENAFLDAKAAAKTFQSAQKSVVAQNEAFKNAQERYSLGAMTLFDFDQVRNRQVNAQSALIRSKFDYYFKTKVLQFYYGEPIAVD